MAEPRVVVYPGSFDPLTLGHEDIARRCLKFADKLIIAVAHTATQHKDRLFSVEDRLAMIEECFSDEPRVEVADFSGLLVDFCKRIGARMVVRGLRAVSDFEYEFQMALMNRNLWPDLEMVFMAPAGRYTFLSASLVREVASLGGDISGFVSAPVLRRMREKTVS
ncbi:MAG: pantetheine-phosphate adenylyltransferase [Gemmatimonadota bacterium]|nr:MAG: pantetheine-phosphate adenylyltransferase [Gemmatimonadota bacterium]